jgi:GNAT superfamily N-acetyltransferase
VRLLRETQVRPLRTGELNHAHNWAIQEKWNPSPLDAHAFNHIDPGSLLTVEVDGAPRGSLSAVCLTEGFGFAGFFVLSPNYRKSVYGWLLLQAGLHRMGDRTIGAESVPGCLGTYEKYGLHPHSRTETWRGVTTALHRPWHIEVALVTDTLLPLVIEYDTRAFGAPRPGFIDYWRRMPESLAVTFIQGARVSGFGMVRKVHQGYRIGPLQADHPEIAAALFDALADFAGDEPVSIDCPDSNPFAPQLMQRKGLRRVSSTIRIFRGTPPVDSPRVIYGRMSLALG